MSSSVHDAASSGFGSAADVYERSRPDYPVEAVDRLVQELEIARPTRILDVGAGTGKLTRMLLPTGAHIVAIDPVEAMWRQLTDVLRGVPVVAGTAEALPFHDQSFDAVVAGQAFHWFDGDCALGEIHRVLKPSGRLGLLWNSRDETVPWVKEISAIIEPYEHGAPREHWKAWREAFSRTDLFGTLHQRRFVHRQELDREGLVDRVRSISFIAMLPRAEREDVLERVRRLAAEHPDLRGHEQVVLPYRTDLYWCSRH